MKLVKLIGVAVLSFAMTSSKCTSTNSRRNVVLPSIHLIGCKTSPCSQIWSDDTTSPGATFPQKVSVDIDDKGVLGVDAKYSKSTALDDISASIDSRYRKWVFPKDQAGRHTLWRVDPERLAIQLSENADGTKEVIYLSARAWPTREEKRP
jgi:hypothetical protein